MVNSIKKGKAYERKIAKKLSLFFDVPFKRVPMSGGFQKHQNVNESRFRGDIFTEDSDWNKRFGYVIECKKRAKKITLQEYLEFLTLRKGILAKWYRQAMYEVKGTEKEFWIIFGSNNGKDMLLTPNGGIYLLDQYFKQKRWK